MGLDRAALEARRREPWGWLCWAVGRSARRAGSRPGRRGAAHPVGDPAARLADAQGATWSGGEPADLVPEAQGALGASQEAPQLAAGRPIAC